MPVELLDRRRWKTRVERANAIFDYLEIDTTADAGMLPRSVRLSPGLDRTDEAWARSRRGAECRPLGAYADARHPRISMNATKKLRLRSIKQRPTEWLG
jgi:hypothetical protein